MIVPTPLRLTSKGTRFARFPLMSVRGLSNNQAAPLVVKLPNIPANVSFVDASWHMPNSPRNAHQEFLKKRLPKAQFLDLDQVASPNALGLKHMMPDSRVFAEYCGESCATGCRLLPH